MYEPDLNTIMTVEEVCDYLRLGKNSVYNLLKSGKLPSLKIGRKWLVPYNCLCEFMHSNKNSL